MVELDWYVHYLYRFLHRCGLRMETEFNCNLPLMELMIFMSATWFKIVILYLDVNLLLYIHCICIVSVISIFFCTLPLFALFIGSVQVLKGAIDGGRSTIQTACILRMAFAQPIILLLLFTCGDTPPGFEETKAPEAAEMIIKGTSKLFGCCCCACVALTVATK